MEFGCGKVDGVQFSLLISRFHLDWALHPNVWRGCVKNSSTRLMQIITPDRTSVTQSKQLPTTLL